MDEKHTRRQFLAGAGALATAALLEGTALAQRATEQTDASEQEDAYWKIYNRYFVPLFGWQNEMKEKGFETVIPHMTMQELTTLRTLFLAKYDVSHRGDPTYLDEMIAAGLLTGERAHQQVFFNLQLFGVHGRVYDAFTSDEYRKLRASLESTWKNLDSYRGTRSTIETHFSVRTEDFIPRGNDLLDTDIDPRVFRVARTKPLSEDRRSIKRQLRDRAGWTEQTRKDAFRKAIDSEDVRHEFTYTDCSLIEMFSIVRFVIEDQESIGEPLVPIQIERVQEYLRRRDEAKVIEFLGPNTECFISITQVEVGRVEDAQDIGTVCGVKEEARVAIDTAKKEQAVDGIRQALQKTKRGTCLYVNSHGYDPKDQRQDAYFNINDTEAIDAATLAGLFVDRMLHFQDHQALKGVSLILGQCYGANFMAEINTYIPQIIMQKMSEHQTGTPEREMLQKAAVALANKHFDYPVACTVSPEDGFGYRHLFGDSIRQFQEAVHKEGFTGAMFMKLQAYYAANMVDPVLFGPDGQPVV